MEKLFEYAILFHPVRTKKDEEDGRSPKSVLVKDVTRVLAKSEQEVTILAAREVPADYLDRITQVVIAVRPF